MIHQSSRKLAAILLISTSLAFPQHVLPTRTDSTVPLFALERTTSRSPLRSDASSYSQSLSDRYNQLTTNHYELTAFAQAAILASSADIVTQTMETASMDIWHVCAMASVAASFSGYLNAIWLQQLEEHFPGRSVTAVMSKTLIHAMILASIINSAYLVGVPFLTEFYHHHGSLSLSHLFDGWSLEEFWVLTKLEIGMFIPYNTLAFQFIPPNIRPLTHAAVSATFNVAVSAVTLGYMDAWVDRLSGVLQM